MGKPVVIGNWKMNTTVSSAILLSRSIVQSSSSIEAVLPIICPPMLALTSVAQIIRDTHIHLGAQDLYPGGFGAFTGEVSASMLQDVCGYVILGHSERRHLMGESDEMVRLKLRSALDHGIIPILCVGETLKQRNSGITSDVVTTQLDTATEGLTPNELSILIVAYEPVWAIGTGESATASSAQAVMATIRTRINSRLIEPNTSALQVLYGGSVSPDNVTEFTQQPDVDGVLVGGASLDPQQFIKICKNLASPANTTI